MNPERWQQISRIFKSAISLDGAARVAYVKEKCASDQDLQAEVQRLIESHEQAEDAGFIGGLAVEDVAEHFADGEEMRALQNGQQFGAYSILDHLGTGGMGEVYLAKDSRLDRTVALKILASDVAADHGRMKRFRQEAKVTSSLNQPNILTIFEFGEVDNLTFLAAEFVDGDTLRDYIRGKQLKLTEILDIGIQILAALDAAHEAKIVHRDMKPDNVMIRRRDQLVKVLDFGLAKVTQKKSTHSELNSEESAITEFKTAPGLIMGTVNYMSPEQAQAKEVDARSDIWSTGVMLYEMVAGAKPFGGSTSAHTIVAIVEKDPPPLPPTVPAELQRIIAKSIAKDANERYQTAKDMLIDLRNLKRRMDLASSTDTLEGLRATQVEASSKSKMGVFMAMIAVIVAAIVGINVYRNMLSTPVVQPASSSAPATAAAKSTLAYWITVQKFRNEKPYQDPFSLRSEINFEAGYRIRLNVRSDRPGYLYVLNEGPADAAKQLRYVALFPSSTANSGAEVLSANEPVTIPEQTWFRFDEEQGVEKVWLVFSEQPIPELAGIKAFASEPTKGLITDAQLNRAVNQFLLSHAADRVTAEKSEKDTVLKAPQNVLVYGIRLEHH